MASVKEVEQRIKSAVIRRKKAIVSVSMLCVLLICSVAAFFIHHKYDLGQPANSSLTAYQMGAPVTVTVYGANEQICKNAAEDILYDIGTLDLEISRREKGSQTGKLNLESGTGFIPAPTVAEIFEKTLSLSEDTNGRFDLSIAPVTQLWDIDGFNPKVPAQAEIDHALQSVGYERVQTRDGSVSLELGQMLDLGAVGKGAACDLAAEILSGTEIGGAVVSVGGSIGVYGKKGEDARWTIEIRDPFDPDAAIGTLHFNDTAFISTSGDYEKFLEEDGKQYHHIFDATTGYPAESDLTSATVVAGSGLMSDALSTACFIVGRKESPSLLTKYGADGVLVDKSRNIYISPGLMDSFSLAPGADYQIYGLD